MLVRYSQNWGLTRFWSFKNFLCQCEGGSRDQKFLIHFLKILLIFFFLKIPQNVIFVVRSIGRFFRKRLHSSKNDPCLRIFLRLTYTYHLSLQQDVKYVLMTNLGSKVHSISPNDEAFAEIVQCQSWRFMENKLSSVH